MAPRRSSPIAPFPQTPRFTLNVESVPRVAEICRRLDEIPLAFELAAARISALSPEQLAQRLDERFRVLTVGDRCARPRHQTANRHLSPCVSRGL